jgi:hypothetical protein
MKNVHLIPTDKPSRLYEDVDCDLRLGYDFIVRQGMLQNQHIYITSDEAIFNENWVIANNGLLAKVTTEFTWHFINSKKIILTTDQDLIKDGVQAIDDDFLEWFVENPTCEKVEIELIDTFKKTNEVYVDEITKGNYYEVNKQYKIIIPQEEPKQELERGITITHVGKQKTLDYLQVCKSCGSEEVARCKWVNVNTEEIYSADSGTTLEWCFNCKSETNIIDKEDYE